MNSTLTRASGTHRNATLQDLSEMLKDEHARKVDVVAPASQIRAVNGNIVLRGSDPILGDDGVTLADGTYRPTDVFDEGIAGKLNIPLKYVRRMRVERPDLYDANVNGWLHGAKPKFRVPADGSLPQKIAEGATADTRSFLVRCFKGDGDHGVARAFLSDRYSIVDNLDALTAALEGVRAAGVDVEIDGCDLTERRMTVRLTAPAVTAYAEKLLDGYRSPFTGQTGTENPTMFAGLQISNSETGDGAFTIVPRLVVQVCNNGMTLTKDAVRAVHLGGRLDDGIIRWSEDTQTKQVELIKAKTADAVATFLDVDYMTREITRMQEKAGKEIEKADETIRHIGGKLRFSEAHTDLVLDHFIRGGQPTAGGLMAAVTSAAQVIDNGDDASDLEAQAVKVLDLV